MVDIARDLSIRSLKKEIRIETLGIFTVRFLLIYMLASFVVGLWIYNFPIDRNEEGTYYVIGKRSEITNFGEKTENEYYILSKTKIDDNKKQSEYNYSIVRTDKVSADIKYEKGDQITISNSIIHDSVIRNIIEGFFLWSVAITVVLLIILLTVMIKNNINDLR